MPSPYGFRISNPRAPMMPQKPKSVISLVVFIISTAIGVLQAAEAIGSVAALPVNEHWQLFLDDYIIARSTGFDRVVHHPQPRGLVIPADKPWETAGAEMLYGTPVGRRK